MTNLNINSYTIQDLLEFASLNNKRIEEITEEDIKSGIDTRIIRSIQLSKPQFTEFFHKVRDKLLEYYDLVNTKIDPVTEKKQGEWVESYDDLVDQKTKKKYNEQFGSVQPNYDERVKYLLNINSHDRKINVNNYTTDNVEEGVDTSETKYAQYKSCNIGDIYNIPEKTFYEEETNFHFTLSEPLKNIMKLTIKQIEIPISWYVFKKDYTCTFKIGPYKRTPEDYFYPHNLEEASSIIISEGNYTNAELIDEINEQFPTGIQNLKIMLDKRTKKVTISADTKFNLYFFLKNIPAQGEIPKVEAIVGCKACDYNLGWLLGFRKAVYFGEKSYQAEAQIDIFGTRTLNLEVWDYQQNCATKNIITIQRLSDFFERRKAQSDCFPPKTQTISKCDNNLNVLDVSGNERARISKKMWQSQQELKHHWRKDVSRLRIPSIGNCFTRIQVEKWKDPDIIFDKPEDCSKRYFGPVTLNKFGVKLKDERGNVLDLNGRHWSIQIEVEGVFLDAEKQFKKFAENRALKKIK